MCGKHWLHSFPDPIAEYFEIVSLNQFKLRYNIAPQAIYAKSKI